MYVTEHLGVNIQTEFRLITMKEDLGLSVIIENSRNGSDLMKGRVTWRFNNLFEVAIGQSKLYGAKFNNLSSFKDIFKKRTCKFSFSTIDAVYSPKGTLFRFESLKSKSL